MPTMPFAPEVQRMLELSLREALEVNHDYVGTEHLLLGLVRERDNGAVQVLSDLGVEPQWIRQRVVELAAPSIAEAQGGEVPKPFSAGRSDRTLRSHVESKRQVALNAERRPFGAVLRGLIRPSRRSPGTRDPSG
jgi:ATP-dependent Clp protease ATP-binding subunit ClpA